MGTDWEFSYGINKWYNDANLISGHAIKSQAAISQLAVVRGFFVEMTRPERDDCEIPMYRTGSMLIASLMKL